MASTLCSTQTTTGSSRCMRSITSSTSYLISKRRSIRSTYQTRKTYRKFHSVTTSFHDEHDEENHNEFYAKYSFECGDTKAINKVEFPYFSTFPNSGELEVQFISSIGSVSFEVEAEEPSINIDGKI